MTMGLAPLLFINKYDIKKLPVLIMLITQLFSFSLAGYIILLFGFLYQSILQRGIKKLLSPIAMISFFSLFFYISTFVYQENLFKELIIARMEWDGNSIAGDDRSSYYLDRQYEKYINSGIQTLTGIGYDSVKSEKGVSGYKLFMVSYGLIGLFLLLSFYCLVIAKRPKTKGRLGLLFLLLLLLYQNSYPIWWCMLVALSCGNVYMKKNDDIPIVDNRLNVL